MTSHMTSCDHVICPLMSCDKTFVSICHAHSYDYHCVIYGWDHQCEMSQAWILQMGVDRLPLGPNQPFYNVLVEDGSNRYAAQGT